MKTKTIYLLAAGVGAFLLYRRSKASAPAVAVKDTQTVAGALGAVMTGNPMLAELGSLGDDAPRYTAVCVQRDANGACTQWATPSSERPSAQMRGYSGYTRGAARGAYGYRLRAW